MGDRELLALAARAAGLEGYISEWVNGPEFVIPGENPITWNPLRDDGDCARMEAICDVNVKWFHSLGAVNSWVEDSGVAPAIATAYEYYSDHGGDKRAARRLASVQVVACIQQARDFPHT